ncbi:MAG: T9SS type A sorting domain-containing protein [Bacteroidota bacterium]
MRKNLLLVSALSGILLLPFFLQAQRDRFAFAVTDVNVEGSNWSYLRKLNLETGKYSDVLLNGNDASVAAFDASSKLQVSGLLKDTRTGIPANAAFATGVAAIAYDKKNNRIYYTPMLIDQLRYIDLKSMKVFYVTDKVFTGMPEKSSDQGNVITRMVIASDGNGYALTNDGTHLLQFTTNKSLKITDLGTLVDDPANKGTSIHNSCSSYGGDMVADDDGNFYVFSARNNVFKVNIETRVATFLGAIKGLPSGFTVNGAAVNDHNQVIVSSALKTTSYFTVDPKTWTATAYQITGTLWHSSDLANSNLIVSGNKPKGVTPELLTNVITNSIDNRVQIYPNPVTNNKFVVQFNQLEAGNYSLQLLDVMGRQVQQRKLNISGENQTQEININPSASRGVYMVKIIDHNSKAILSTKVVVQ